MKRSRARVISSDFGEGGQIFLNNANIANAVLPPFRKVCDKGRMTTNVIIRDEGRGRGTESAKPKVQCRLNAEYGVRSAEWESRCGVRGTCLYAAGQGALAARRESTKVTIITLISIGKPPNERADARRSKSGQSNGVRLGPTASNRIRPVFGANQSGSNQIKPFRLDDR